MREVLKYALGIVLAVVLLAFCLRGVDRRALGEALRSASITGVVLAAVVNLAHNVFRTWRWRILLAPVRPHVGFRPMFVAIIVGYLTTWVLPGRLGELVRPALISAREKIPIGPCLGSVVTDRVLDGAGILMLFAVGTWVTPIHGAMAGTLRKFALVMLAACVVVVVGAVLAGRFRGTLERWFGRRRGIMGWIGRSILSVASGTEALGAPRLLAAALAHSLLAWLTIAAGTWIGVRAAGAEIPFSAILVMMPILAFGIAVPTPGGAGGYHLLMKEGLTRLFGVSVASSIAAGILMWLAIVVPVIVLGTLFLKTERISWHDMVAAARGLKHLGAETAPSVRDAGEVPP